MLKMTLEFPLSKSTTKTKQPVTITDDNGTLEQYSSSLSVTFTLITGRWCLCYYTLISSSVILLKINGVYRESHNHPVKTEDYFKTAFVMSIIVLVQPYQVEYDHMPIMLNST